MNALCFAHLQGTFLFVLMLIQFQLTPWLHYFSHRPILLVVVLPTLSIVRVPIYVSTALSFVFRKLFAITVALVSRIRPNGSTYYSRGVPQCTVALCHIGVCNMHLRFRLII